MVDRESYIERPRQEVWCRMRLGFTVFVVLILGGGDVLAQSDRAAITGTARDTSGAVIVGAMVTATNVGNNLQSTSTTNSLGIYNVLDLPIGQYKLACTKEGFAKYQRSEVNLDVAQAAQVDIVLSVGAKSETAAVSVDPLLLETQSSSVSTNLNNDAVTELPLNVQGGRNLSAFMFAYVPGVEGNGVNPADHDFGSHIDGSLSKTKEVMIDGTSAVSQIGGYLSESSPPMEAVEEFQVTAAGIRADEGRTGGGVFRYEMKSGANAWHGSGFYYMHNEAFDARSWSNSYNEGVCLG